jgi:hypothetical protein
MATKMVKLWCENGKHNWKRPSQRGKRPHNCPKHQPEPVVSEPKSKTKKLWCENGKHHWKWERRGGFEPKNCPEHKPVKDTSGEFEDLHCVNGNHTWTRKRTRGKKPVNCPLHNNSVKGEGGLGAIKARRTPKNGQEPILHGLGKIKARKRTGLRNLQSAYFERRKNEAQEKVDGAVKRYEDAFDEERAVFEELDRLENMKMKNKKVQKRIQALHEEWERKSRKLNNMYSGAHYTIAANRSILY